jgi:hypothetical protein
VGAARVGDGTAGRAAVHAAVVALRDALGGATFIDVNSTHPLREVDAVTLAHGRAVDDSSTRRA